MRVIWSFCLSSFFLFFVTTSQRYIETGGNRNVDNNNDTILCILINGIIEVDQSCQLVAKKYGFEYRGGFGCDASKRQIDSVNARNDSVYSILKERHGINWHHRFSNEGCELYEKEKKAIALINKKQFIIDFAVINSKDPEMSYKMEQASDDVLKFIFYSYNYRPKLLTKIYCKIRVDLNKDQVILESKDVHVYDGDYFE